jgi:antitoxin ParD1/3/4
MAADSKATEATAKIAGNRRHPHRDHRARQRTAAAVPAPGHRHCASRSGARSAGAAGAPDRSVGAAQPPPSFNSIDDLAYFYLDLIDALDLTDPIVVDVSLGGWIAAEMAVKSCARLQEATNAIEPHTGKHFERFISSPIKSRRYASASEVMRDSLRLLEEREKLREARLKSLRAEIAAGQENGAGELLDMDAIKADARKQRNASRRET